MTRNTFDLDADIVELTPFVPEAEIVAALRTGFPRGRMAPR